MKVNEFKNFNKKLIYKIRIVKIGFGCFRLNYNEQYTIFQNLLDDKKLIYRFG